MMELRLDSDADERAALLHVAETVRPATAAVQWLAFRFRSDGLLTHSPGSHFAVVLRARVGRDAAGEPASLSGRGMTLGDTSAAYPPPGHPLSDRPGFGGARGAGVESFWPGGNFLYRDTAVLPDGLVERCWYAVRLEVDDARWIRFQIAAADGRHPQAAACVQDRSEHPVLAGATGVLIGLGRDRRETGPWSVELRDIRFGWRPAD